MEEAPVLPPPVIAAEPVIQWSPVPAVVAWQHGTAFRFVRPTGESMMSTWAARDPEGAGQWLNQNRAIPNFADYVRGYAIQIATIDPDAARQWAAQLNGNGNRFALGGTLEQHIDAIAEMLKPAAAVGGSAPSDQQSKASSMFLLDYTPRLVRQHPGEDPVIEMEPVNPFA